MADDSLLEKDWQIIQEIVDRFTKEQLRIEPKKNGLTTELKKVVAHLYVKVSNGNSQDKRVSDEFFQYLKILSDKGKQIARSGKTPDYYRAIYRICTEELKDYHDQPILILQILGWVTRLLPYYKDIHNSQIIATRESGDTSQRDNHPKPKKSKSISTSRRNPQPSGKTALELAFEQAKQKQGKND